MIEKNKILNDIQIPKGMRLLTIPEITKVFDSKNYKNILVKANNREFWSYVWNYSWIENRVAWFVAGSDWADLNYNGGPSDSYPALGVVLCRDLKKVKNGSWLS